MPNLEYKKDCVCEGDLNLARNLLLKDDDLSPDRRFSSYGIFGSLGKAPAARKSDSKGEGEWWPGG